MVCNYISFVCFSEGESAPKPFWELEAFWLNSWSELFIGVFFSVVILRWLMGLSKRRQWKSMRTSHAAFLARDLRKLTHTLENTLLAFAVLMARETDQYSDFFHANIKSSEARVGHIRAWVNSSAAIYPTSKLSRMASLEYITLNLDSSVDLYLKNIEYFLRKCYAREFTADHREALVQDTQDVYTDLRDFEDQITLMFSKFGGAFEMELAKLKGDLERFENEANENLSMVAPNASGTASSYGEGSPSEMLERRKPHFRLPTFGKAKLNSQDRNRALLVREKLLLHSIARLPASGAAA